MRRLSARLLVALLTFTIGVLAASLWLASLRSTPEVISVMESPPASAPVEQKRTYEPGAHASGRAGSYRACWSVVSSSDGMSFSRTSIYYNSPKRALRELQKYLKQAIEVVKREPTFDGQGRQLSEQVVATFAPHEGSSVPSAKLLWVEGSDFGYVGSASLQNILEYEKDHKR